MTDPLAIFDEWLGEATRSEPNDPEAMAVASVGADGMPSVRMVLLKGHDARGFVFYTNLESRKGTELLAHPQTCLMFHWKTLRRAVRIEGHASRVADGEADAYFGSRGRDSQLGAWASDQSRTLPARDLFEARVEDAKRRFAGAAVPRPPHWSGFRVVPGRIEFWRDRPHRLHERRLFTAQDDGAWREELLYP